MVTSALAAGFVCKRCKTRNEMSAERSRDDVETVKKFSYLAWKQNMVIERKEVALSRTEKAMMRAICGIKLIDRKNTIEF